MVVSQPTRAETRRKLEELAVGHIMPEECAEWANQWVMADDPDVEDAVVWRALLEMSGADLQINPDEYLHSDLDYREWLAEFDRSAAGH